MDFELIVINRKLDIILDNLGISQDIVNPKGEFYLATSPNASYIMGPYRDYLSAYKQCLNLKDSMGKSFLSVYEMRDNELHKISIGIEENPQ